MNAVLQKEYNVIFADSLQRKCTIKEAGFRRFIIV